MITHGGVVICSLWVWPLVRYGWPCGWCHSMHIQLALVWARGFIHISVHIQRTWGRVTGMLGGPWRAGWRGLFHSCFCKCSTAYHWKTVITVNNSDSEKISLAKIVKCNRPATALKTPIKQVPVPTFCMFLVSNFMLCNFTFSLFIVFLSPIHKLFSAFCYGFNIKKVKVISLKFHSSTLPILFWEWWAQPWIQQSLLSVLSI